MTPKGSGIQYFFRVHHRLSLLQPDRVPCKKIKSDVSSLDEADSCI